jgi:hypothetical protein
MGADPQTDNREETSCLRFDGPSVGSPKTRIPLKALNLVEGSAMRLNIQKVLFVQLGNNKSAIELFAIPSPRLAYHSAGRKRSR